MRKEKVYMGGYEIKNFTRGWAERGRSFIHHSHSSLGTTR
jgi:hypothetical protein